MTKFETYTILLQTGGIICTLFAVGTALYLAYKERKISIFFYSGKYQTFSDNSNFTSPDVLMIRITNRGIYPIIVLHVGWEIGFFKKFVGLQLFHNELNPNQLPKSINYGEEISLKINWNVFVQEIIPKIIEEINSKPFFYK